MNRMVNRILATLAIGLLVAISGCGSGPTPDGAGEVTVDPVGDLAKLQGRWSLVPQGEGPLKWPESYLVFDGNIVTYDHPSFRKMGQRGDIVRYRFVLNSASDPKTIRFTRRLEEDKDIALPPTHKEYNKRYKLEDDTLTIWTFWSEQGEQPYYVYKRVHKV